MQANVKHCSLLITLVTPDFSTGKCPPVTFNDIGFFQQGLSTSPASPEADVARAFQTFLQSEHQQVGILT